MKIKCAAIRHPDSGVIYEGASHCEIGLRMLGEGVCGAPFPGGECQGFVTECGMFVRRAAAMAIAIEAGQVVRGQTMHPRELFSEDLRATACPPRRRGHALATVLAAAMLAALFCSCHSAPDRRVRDVPAWTNAAPYEGARGPSW